jgi:hypothetical protein
VSELCLSRDEIRDLTRTPVRARQAAFLRANGIRHYLDAHGWPVVLRSSVEQTAPVAALAAAWTPRKAANG